MYPTLPNRFYKVPIIVGSRGNFCSRKIRLQIITREPRLPFCLLAVVSEESDSLRTLKIGRSLSRLRPLRLAAAAAVHNLPEILPRVALRRGGDFLRRADGDDVAACVAA